MKIFCILSVFLLFGASCTKLVHIEPPVASITTSQVFADSSDAVSGILGIYSILANAQATFNPSGFGNGSVTEICGLSADELLEFDASNNYFSELFSNTITAGNPYSDGIWINAYPILYQANASIEGLKASSSVSQGLLNELMGEAKWFRAFINFYLTNLYGPIPLITSSNYTANQAAFRASQSSVYQLIVSDLTDAQRLLPSDYSVGNGERIRINSWAATALLARVYLYQQKWDSAEIESSAILNNTALFSLVGLDSVFLKNSNEAILQWHNNVAVNAGTYNATSEGWVFVPTSNSNPPNFYLSDSLLNNFDSGDMRKVAWVDSTIYSGTSYYYPYKYKIGSGQAGPDSLAKEYYTVLRLAEQYLIRAEARANQGKLSDAINDINFIRQRASLPLLPNNLNQSQVLAAIAHERRIEFFSEWGHRWFDLKRTSQATAVLSQVSYKSAWKASQQLYPIPLSERQTDPNLTQNPGY